MLFVELKMLIQVRLKGQTEDCEDDSRYWGDTEQGGQESDTMRIIDKIRR